MIDPSVGLRITHNAIQRRGSHQGPDRLVQRILDSDLPSDEKVKHLFEMLLARDPNDKETSLVGELLKERPEREVLLDVWWALVNNGESSQ